MFILIPLCGAAQQADSLKIKKNSLKSVEDTIRENPLKAMVTSVSGQVTDAVSGQPIPFTSIRFTGSAYGASSDKQGRFMLSVPGGFNRVTFSIIGYQSVTRTIKPGRMNELQARLAISQTQLKEVSVKGSKRYRNKGNPAVELIQEVIDHKEQNRMESSDYLQYDQYERTGLFFSNLSPKLFNNRYLRQYSFMLDSSQKINGKAQTTLPVFFSEKLLQNYYRKNPEKSIQVLNAQKEINVIKFIDTAGAGIYLNRLYGNNIDIYSNNIFIITNQFLSPIADHSPDFYQFFIVDTVQSGKQKLVNLRFRPRNKGDLLFEGTLRITLDDRYAVVSCEMNIDRQTNLNFMRSLGIRVDFQQYPDGHYYLTKSNVKADFGILKNGSKGIFGEREIFYSNYKLNSPLPAAFYNGKKLQTLPNFNQQDSSYWAHYRADTLSPRQARVYAHINQLANMPSFKTTSWITSTLFLGYADAGPVQIGPTGSAVIPLMARKVLVFS